MFGELLGGTDDIDDAVFLVFLFAAEYVGITNLLEVVFGFCLCAAILKSEVTENEPIISILLGCSLLLLVFERDLNVILLGMFDEVKGIHILTRVVEVVNHNLIIVCGFAM